MELWRQLSLLMEVHVIQPNQPFSQTSSAFQTGLDKKLASKKFLQSRKLKFLTFIGISQLFL